MARFYGQVGYGESVETSTVVISVVDNGDGSWTITDATGALLILTGVEFNLLMQDATNVGTDTYEIPIDSVAGISTGVWVDQITELSYFGDVIRNTRRLQNGESLNDDISVSNSISILADQYAVENFFLIKYVRWNDILWSVSNVEVKPPRLILTLGSVYNGPTA